jgi:molybdopterin-containing oxidoreductase family iron-sulfur binding subunit
MTDRDAQSSAHNTDQARRRFLAGVMSAGALSALPGVHLIELAQARAPEEAVTDDVRWGMLVDTNSCAEGCTACVDACGEEHRLTDFGRPETDARWIRKVDLVDRSTGRAVSLPLMCQHCEHPPCVDVCPTGASFKRDDGIVLVDKHICIGCRYCMLACPYKARSFVHEPITDQAPHAPRGKGTVESCTFCVHRVDTGEQPACVDACDQAGHNALLFGDLNNPESEISLALRAQPSRALRGDLALNPSVRYQGI